MKCWVFLCCILCWNYAMGTSFYEDYKNDIAPAASSLDRQLSDGAASSLLQYPELKFEPNIDGLIRYIKAAPETYAKYIEKIKQVIDAYDNERQTTETGNIMDCQSYHEYRPPNKWGETCRFDLTYEVRDFSGQCYESRDFGFLDGMACIYLSLDRVYNWVPEPYTNETVPDAIRDFWREEIIRVTCEPGPDPVSIDKIDVIEVLPADGFNVNYFPYSGQSSWFIDPVSIDNIKSIDVLPVDGFHVKYFPYGGQSSWLSPLVIIKVISRPAVVVQVKCKAWAKNIEHRDLLNTGTVTFDLMVDGSY